MKQKTIKEAELEIKDKLMNRINIEKIKQFVDRHYGFDIDRNTRKDEYIQARTMYYFLSREYTSRPLSDIGALLDKDHATVLHSIKNNHGFYMLNNQNYKNGLNSFLDYIIRYVQILDKKDPNGDNVDAIAIKESVLYYENTKLKHELDNIKADYDILRQNERVSSVLSNIVNKIPENKLSLVVERLEAMVKML
jgi:hypothetical protein